MPRIALLIAVALAMAAALPAAEKKPVTIEAAARVPPARVGAVLWAPDGRRFSYTENRVLWLYDVPTAARRELADLRKLDEKAVKYDLPEAFGWQNRGVAEQALQWSAAGDAILASEAGDLFLIHPATGAWEQLTATAWPERDPKLSPDGRRVSFRRDHDLYVLEIASRKVTRLTHDGTATLLNGELDWVYPEELALGTAHWWSPDSTRIAYLQFDVSREWMYPQADLLRRPARYEPQRFPIPGSPNAEVRLGVVAASGGATRWMELGDPRDTLLARVSWAPDSREIYAQRLNRVQNRLDLMAAGAQTGAARTVLHEEDPYWVNVNDVFRFLKDGRRFLWGSERDGFLHLYLYTLEGKLLRQLTHGSWVVTQVAGVDESAREVFYVSTDPSPLERQLWRVGFDGRRPRRITTMPGTHGISLAPTCEYYLDNASNLTTPPARTLHARDGREIGVWRAAGAQEYETLPVEIVEVRAADGTPLYARLIRPKGFVPGRKYPVTVEVYGGPHAQAVRNTWAGTGFDQAMAQRGYVVWQLDNRGTSGRGHAFEAKVFRNLGAAELADQRDGIRHLLGMGFADPARIAIHGWSYGGFMTLYALTHAPELFRAGIAGAPVTDWRNYDTIYTERYMGLPGENPEGYRRSSPIQSAAALTARLLILHNLEDDNVHFQNTVQMADALERAGKLFHLIAYPQKTHGVTGTVRRQMYEAMAAFFDEALK